MAETLWAASVMGRLALLALELSLFQHEIELPHFVQVRDTGDYAGDSGFTACHFFLPEEMAAAFRAQGVTILEMVGLEGLGSLPRGTGWPGMRRAGKCGWRLTTRPARTLPW